MTHTDCLRQPFSLSSKLAFATCSWDTRPTDNEHLCNTPDTNAPVMRKPLELLGARGFAVEDGEKDAPGL